MQDVAPYHSQILSRLLKASHGHHSNKGNQEHLLCGAEHVRLVNDHEGALQHELERDEELDSLSFFFRLVNPRSDWNMAWSSWSGWRPGCLEGKEMRRVAGSCYCVAML
jgi:hypothetical protein